jgi:hypothetical protein
MIIISIKVYTHSWRYISGDLKGLVGDWYVGLTPTESLFPRTMEE